MPENPIIQTIPAQYRFTEAESLALGKSLVERFREYESTEREAKSIAADYKAKLTRIDTAREQIAQRIADGFEMRDTIAIVYFDLPRPGRKTYCRAIYNEKRELIGDAEIIKEEEMSYEDKQRKLPLEEPKPAPNNEELAGSFDSAAAPQSKDTPPEGYIFVTGGVSREGDACWCKLDERWEPIAEAGLAFDHFHALARPIIAAPAEPEPAPENPNAGQTPMALALHAAAAGKDLPLVPVKLSTDFPPSKNLMQFRKSARKIGWGEAALDLIDEEAGKVIDPSDDDESNVRLFALLNPHCVEAGK